MTREEYWRKAYFGFVNTGAALETAAKLADEDTARMFAEYDKRFPASADRIRDERILRGCTFGEWKYERAGAERDFEELKAQTDRSCTCATSRPLCPIHLTPYPEKQR